MQIKRIILISLIITFFLSTGVDAEDSPLKVFGYFQNGFQHQKARESSQLTPQEIKKTYQSTFILQQLNIFLQKNISDKWTALINFQMLNSYSSSKKWGSFNLEEAWIRYRSGKMFNLKLGLQIPIFNNLNEIKNKTPLLSYIIRPLVYESSFGEFLSLEEYQPFRAYVQTYGFVPVGKVKFDYAAYLGNSSNINDLMGFGQTGVDTTANILAGGRLGVRYTQLKFGASGTYERVNRFTIFYDRDFHTTFPSLKQNRSDYENITALRFGMDLSYYWKRFYFESEYIRVYYEDKLPSLNFNKWFYYWTLGYQLTDNFDFYVSYWFTREHHIAAEFPPFPDALDKFIFDILVPTVGSAYNINERIVVKAQYAPVDLRYENAPFPDEKSHFYAMAISVIF